MAKKQSHSNASSNTRPTRKTKRATARKADSPVLDTSTVAAKETNQPQALPGPVKLIKDTLRMVWGNKKLWLGIMGVYIVLQLVMVQGVVGGNVQQFLDDFRSLYDGVSSNEQRLAVLTYILMTTGKATTTTGVVLQSLTTVIVTLALLWGLRQVVAGTTVRIRDAFYRGMYPLIPFVLVFLVVLLQTLPLLIGLSLFQATVISGVAVGLIEQIFWSVVTLLLIFLTIYWLCSSLIALYIVTLPDMTPLAALRSARKLVRLRRAAIFLRVLVFGLFIFIISALIVVPLVFSVPYVASWAFYLVGAISYGLFVSFVYRLYRGLLNES